MSQASAVPSTQNYERTASGLLVPKQSVVVADQAIVQADATALPGAKRVVEQQRLATPFDKDAVILGPGAQAPEKKIIIARTVPESRT